ncbi:peptidylprolyl isomerase [Petrotoga sp. 9PWA.NaAc.5.4]|uniref:peptidylprolyl isomerase n=1 Tax=Petrotoga sp. 9PWA.NaAc.5.4 TaxID=1434328 RepID=UPI000CAC4CE2|nr:peptidylprolyl isomerase [Petrotoga sp. 9PWA.NaAc.5.4]PNR94000.1 hypothetical protein X924_07285 [Petrotoga sp. 9PWA.NaAc.5.4]
MKKSIVLFGIFTIILSSFVFSQSIAYLSSKEGNIYESYFLEYNELMGEYYNAILTISLQNQTYDTYFNKPADLLLITDVLMEYKAMEKFLNDNSITLDATGMNQRTQEIFDSYMGNETTKQMFLQFFESEDIFKGFVKSLVYRDEIYNKIIQYFSDFSNEDLSNFVSENFDALKSQFESVKINIIVLNDESNAKILKEQLINNEISFTDAVSKNSIDGGSLGWVKRGDVSNEVFEASISANIGDIIGPIRTFSNYQIVEVEEKKVYQTVEELLSEPEINSQIKNIYLDYLLTNWYNEYLLNFDFVVSYKPLMFEYEVYKARSIEDLLEIEKNYRPIILSENTETIPEEWYISYIYLAENLYYVKDNERFDLENYLNIVDNYPELIEYNEDELQTELEYYLQIKYSAESTDLRNQAAEKQYAIQEFIQIQYKYGRMTISEATSKYEELNKDIENMNLALEKALKDLIDLNPNSINIIGKLYQLKPNDPNIAFDYYKTLYSSYIDYYNATGDLKSIKDGLNTLRSIMNSLPDQELESNRATKKYEIINQIDELIKM